MKFVVEILKSPSLYLEVCVWLHAELVDTILLYCNFYMQPCCLKIRSVTVTCDL